MVTDRIHHLKTGALISAAILMGAMISGQATERDLYHLQQVGYWLGLGFQIRDDNLDVTASTEQLGKPQGSDHSKQKATYPSLLGLAQAEKKALHCLEEAKSHLAEVNGMTALLYELGRYLIVRNY